MKVENDIYKEFKNAHYKMWDDIAKQVKHVEAINGELHSIYIYKYLWICEKNCNECLLKDVLDGCMDVRLEDVCKAFSSNDYDKAYKWAIKIRDCWR